MSIKVYEYKNCSTCKKALKWLDANKKHFTSFQITDNPPSVKEIEMMLEHIKGRGGSFKQLFNTSGVQYREKKIAEKIKKGMTEEEAIELLAQNGRLIKRPFVISKRTGAVGFQEDVWRKLF